LFRNNGGGNMLGEAWKLILDCCLIWYNRLRVHDSNLQTKL
jgi:hypothetical protein